MVSFDHREPGTPEQRWLATDWWSDLPALELDDVRRVVVVAAHPDDESLGAGGLVARATALGIAVTVVVASDGEGSHPASPAHTPADLAATRRREVVTAVGALGRRVALRFLALPDGGLREHAGTLEDEIEAALGPAARRSGVLLCAPWRGDGHRDHRVAGAAAAAVAGRAGVTLLEYPVWFWHWGSPDSLPGDLPVRSLRRLDLAGDERDAKSRAVAAHASQHRPLSPAPGDEALLHAEMLGHFARPFEVFVRTDASSARADPADSAPGCRSDGDSLPRAFFDDFYRGRSDPWGFETRWYEQRKRALTVASLPRERFTSALEVGCSTGRLTLDLAPRCDRLLGVDIAAAPLAVARRRFAGTPWDAVTSFEQRALPDDWPDGRFDLVVLSEVGYYLGRADLDRLLDAVTGALTPDGVVVACHWRHPVAEYPLGGDAVHDALAARGDLDRVARHDEADFLLDVLTPPPGRSVAQVEGLA
ncbi:bifunctional PIG-L family deacetylase/class I SAM-dependent methyltransferase [Luteimicrobium subarcticum]|uniref:LmbE family N-acetylglucosaminyl deacetylase n=1 Tax=Luteimicrobium subarcticum TaxID=620910 RepID=A0A2M8WRF2_9MICO|nr:bifunctional PIG-L family deacetylase/class I SAM-dependent methyltransferase [Luteimicrobium subarcticum]PJI93522.1 LmbE family N-acetylglucosaminyl deacetylase [Luteimicrobium subarcticum]